MPCGGHLLSHKWEWIAIWAHTKIYAIHCFSIYQWNNDNLTGKNFHRNKYTAIELWKKKLNKFCVVLKLLTKRSKVEMTKTTTCYSIQVLKNSNTFHLDQICKGLRMACASSDILWYSEHSDNQKSHQPFHRVLQLLLPYGGPNSFNTAATDALRTWAARFTRITEYAFRLTCSNDNLGNSFKPLSKSW